MVPIWTRSITLLTTGATLPKAYSGSSVSAVVLPSHFNHQYIRRNAFRASLLNRLPRSAQPYFPLGTNERRAVSASPGKLPFGNFPSHPPRTPPSPPCKILHLP